MEVKCMKNFFYLSGGNLEKFFSEGTCPEKLLYERSLQSTATTDSKKIFEALPFSYLVPNFTISGLMLSSNPKVMLLLNVWKREAYKEVRLKQLDNSTGISPSKLLLLSILQI
jgi:hypothetical protein